MTGSSPPPSYCADLVYRARCILTLLLVIWCMAALRAGAADNEILTVNQAAVPKEEFIFFMQQERSEVIAESGSTLETNFWNHRHGGTTPKKLLREKTIARVTQEKVRQQLFRELGLLKSTDFADFLNLVEQSNREREQAVKQGRVVYGPVDFTPQQYYGDWTAKLELQAKDKLANNRLAMTETELRTFYRTNPDSFRSPEFSDWEIVTIQKVSTNAGSTDLVRQLAEIIRSKMRRATNTESICREIENRSDIHVTLARQTRLDNGHLGELFPNEQDFHALIKLKPGRCHQLKSAPDKIQIVRCVSRMAATVRPFEEVAGTVRRKLLDQKYAAWLDALTGQAEVQVNRAALDTISIQ